MKFIYFVFLVMTGDDLAAIDSTGFPGILPSRSAKTSFVTLPNGHSIFSNQLFQEIGNDPGNQPSGSGIVNPDIDNQPTGAGIGTMDDDESAVAQASFVIAGHESLGAGDAYQVMVDTQSISNHTLGSSVSRQLFPAVAETPRRSGPPPTSATSGTGNGRKRARDSRPAPASDPAQASVASVPPLAGSVANAADASVEYFRSLSRNNTVLSQVRFLAYQSTISVNRKREEVLELQRLEMVERLKKLDPLVAIPSPKRSLFSYKNDMCTADPSDMFVLDEEEEEESEDGERKVSILIFIHIKEVGGADGGRGRWEGAEDEKGREGKRRGEGEGKREREVGKRIRGRG